MSKAIWTAVHGYVASAKAKGLAGLRLTCRLPLRWRALRTQCPGSTSRVIAIGGFR
jgi:hypothetical protein